MSGEYSAGSVHWQGSAATNERPLSEQGLRWALRMTLELTRAKGPESLYWRIGEQLTDSRAWLHPPILDCAPLSSAWKQGRSVSGSVETGRACLARLQLRRHIGVPVFSRACCSLMQGQLPHFLLGERTERPKSRTSHNHPVSVYGAGRGVGLKV